MATRLYLSSAPFSAPLISMPFAAWTSTTPMVAGGRLACNPAKKNTALTTLTGTEAAASGSQMYAQFVSPPLKAGSIAAGDTLTITCKACCALASGSPYFERILKLIDQSGNIRATLLSQLTQITDAMYKTTLTTCILPATAMSGAVTVVDGDRLVLEIGAYSSSAFSGANGLRVGDPSATADFANTAGLTTDLCSWFELSSTLSFYSEQYAYLNAIAAALPSGGSYNYLIKT